jgi:hypothetical protein
MTTTKGDEPLRPLCDAGASLLNRVAVRVARLGVAVGVDAGDLVGWAVRDAAAVLVGDAELDGDGAVNADEMVTVLDKASSDPERSVTMASAWHDAVMETANVNTVDDTDTTGGTNETHCNSKTEAGVDSKAVCAGPVSGRDSDRMTENGPAPSPLWETGKSWE